RDVLVLARCRENHLLGAAQLDVGPRCGRVRELPRALQDEVDPKVTPGQLSGVLLAKHAQALPVDRDPIAVSGYGAWVDTKDGVVFQQVGQSSGVGEVVDGDNLDLRMPRRGTQRVATDAAKAVDANSDGHNTR